MRKSSRAAMAALMLLAATAACADGQENVPLPQGKQDSGAMQNPKIQSPHDQGRSEAKPDATVFDRLEVQGILGKEVRSDTGQNMGRIVDVIVDRGGQVRAAIIDVGGFLGVGNRKVAVAWNALRFPPDEKDPDKVGHIGLELTREQLQAAPEYKEDKPVVVVGASAALQSLPFP